MSFRMQKALADGIAAGSGSDNDHDGDKGAMEAVMTSDLPLKPTTSTPRFVAELRPEEVRWFYKKTTQDKTWQPLNGHDSLAIEAAYRRRSGLEKAATNEQASTASAAVSDSEITDQQQSVVVFGGLYRLVYENAESPDSPTKTTSASETTSTRAASPSTFSNAEKSAGATTTKDKCVYRLKPIYWEGGSLFLTRGTWFLEAAGGDYQPLDADSAEFVQKIEQQHLKVFSKQRIPDRPVYFDKKGPLPVLCEVADAEEEKYAGSGARARWHSVIDVLLINNSRSSRLWRYLKLTTADTKLTRGYHTEAKFDDGPAPVTHLCFVIHGIGQKRQRSRIVTNATSMREIADQLLRSNYPNLVGRPMFLPVDWRSELQLDENLIASITPNYLEQIRGFFNETLLDLLYYASPMYGPEVIRGMSAVLNRMYQLYLSNDPDFEARGGRVCLIAHSLGSVITYDILTGSWAGQSMTPGGSNDQISITPGVNAEMTRLKFPVDHLFCFGSPLGVFLACRNRRGLRIIREQEENAGVANEAKAIGGFRLHNIYHPADPVAYRIEPLISEIYSGVRPLRVHRYNSTEYSPYEELPPEIQSTRSSARSRSASGGAKSENGQPPTLQASESEENVSGFESDEGPSAMVSRTQKLAATPASPLSKRSWSAAVLGRLGIGKSEKDSSTPPRPSSPDVAVVTDGEKPAKEGAGETVVLAKAVEQATEAIEATSTPQPKTVEKKDSEKEKTGAKKREKETKEKLEKAESLEIPPSEALPYRIDYTLRLGRMEYAYWAALVSHISYWANHDAVMYVLSSLYGPPKSPSAPNK